VPGDREAPYGEPFTVEDGRLVFADGFVCTPID
jgi:hypothetical protein